MRTIRIIPCLDVDKGRVVKGVNFIDLKDSGNPVDLASFYYNEGADELVFLDISASFENRSIILDVVENVATQIFIPFSVGGAIDSVARAKSILFHGADKVTVNSQAVKNPILINELSDEFGAQCVVVAIDIKKVSEAGKMSYKVFINGGRTPTQFDVFSWVEEVQKRGCGEILLTSMDSDGTQQGYDLELLLKVSRNVDVPLIASGGAGSLQDFKDAIENGADAVLAASVFHFGKFRIRDVKNYLAQEGFSVRNS